MRQIKMFFQTVVAAAAFVLAAPAHAEILAAWDTYDNNPIANNGSKAFGYVGEAHYSLAVKFIPTVSGALRDITVPLAPLGEETPDSVQLTLRLDNAGLPGSVVATFQDVELDTPQLQAYTTTASQNVYLVAGTTYWIAADTTLATEASSAGAIWSSIETGVGTWAWCFDAACTANQFYPNDNGAPAFELRVETTSSDLLFDFNDEPTGSSGCYSPNEDGNLICDYPYFDESWEDTTIRVGFGGVFSGSLVQQNVAAGFMQLVRTGISEPVTGAAGAQMTFLKIPAFTGVKRLRFTLSNRHTQPVLVRVLIDDALYDPITWPGLARTIPANTVQTICFSRELLGPNSTFTSVYIQTTDYGESPTVTWDNLYVDAYESGPDPSCEPPTALDNEPTPEGFDVPVVQLDQFQMTAANVITAGFTSADFCIAPDPREVKSGATWRYTARTLRLSELANRGTCKGDTSDGGTWAQTLAVTGLEVAPWFRTFLGKPKIGPVGVKGVEAPWIVVAIIRTSAEYRGAVGVSPLAEKLIDYSYIAGALSPEKQELQCDAPLNRRPLSLGGTVAAFEDVMNVEDERMILETGQCDGGVGLTRRTTHIFPVRLDNTLYSERSNAMTQLDGIARTLTRAESQCSFVDPTKIATLRGYLNAARAGVTQGTNTGYDNAVTQLHLFATYTNSSGTFDNCANEANYLGTFVVRSINAAFTVFDRLRHPLPDTTPGPSGPNWVIYFPPAELNLPLILPAP